MYGGSTELNLGNQKKKKGLKTFCCLSTNFCERESDWKPVARVRCTRKRFWELSAVVTKSEIIELNAFYHNKYF